MENSKPLRCKASKTKISELKPPDKAKVLQSQELQDFSYFPASSFFPIFPLRARRWGKSTRRRAEKAAERARICAHTSAEIAKILAIRVAVLCPCSSLGALHSPPKRSQRIGRRNCRGIILLYALGASYATQKRRTVLSLVNAAATSGRALRSSRALLSISLMLIV